MAGQSNTVTLTFAANTKPLADGLHQVDSSLGGVQAHLAQASTSSQQLGHELETAGRNAKSTAVLMRGMGSASVLMGGQVGVATQDMILAATATKELTHGMGGLIGRVGVLRLSLAGLAIAGAAVAVSATDQNHGWSNLKEDGFKPAAIQLSILNNVVQKAPGHLGFLGAALDSATDKLRIHSGWAGTAAGDLARLAAQADATAKALYALRNQPHDVVTEGGSAANLLDNGGMALAELQGASYIEPAKIKKAGGAGLSAAERLARAAKEAAAKLAQARDAVASAMGGIVQALAGKLSAKDADTAGTLEHQLNGTFALEGGKRGATLLEKLRKQAKDTKLLAKDLQQLAKMGLDKGLLSQLVAGGLDSLPAAEELLRGGKADINTANVLNSQIQGRAGSIAVAEASRNLGKKERAQVDINIKGGEGDLAKLLAKWIRNNGAASLGLKAA